MNRILKRKRRSSNSSQDDEDYVCSSEKRGRQMRMTSETECVPSPPNLYVVEEDSSVQEICREEVVETSECECGSCTQNHSETSHHLSEVEPVLEVFETEFFDRSYTSCGDMITRSEIGSSPVAGSIIIDSDLENDDEMEEVHNHGDEHEDLGAYEDMSVSINEKICPLENSDTSVRYKTVSKAVTFMGQLTPGSSIGTCSRTRGSPDVLYSSEMRCPVPHLSWADRQKFWQVMCRKDELSVKDRNPELFSYQQYLKPRMRIILLDWISEVATVFNLHRETYYLTIDYIDRYLSSVPNIPKQQLQLIGVTCLLLASKMEEIYPPKIEQFANITDGACTEEEIFSMEITILTHLNWLLSPITVNNWLEMMLQFIYQKLEKKKNYNLFTPHFSSTLFKRLCQLLDLVTLDITSLRFSYCILAAAAIYILVDPDWAISISGLKKEVLEPCVQWMSVYWKVLRETYSPEMDKVHDLLNDRSEIYFGHQHPEIQTHNISIQLYERVQEEFESIENQKETVVDPQILTPPSSSSKSSSTFASSSRTQSKSSSSNDA